MAKKSTKGKKAKSVAKKDKIAPVGDRVLLREVVNTHTKTASGIYIPENVDKDKGAKRGVVVALGDGRTENGKLIPIKLKVGETVLYGWGDQIEIDGEKYVIVRESEITAILN